MSTPEQQATSPHWELLQDAGQLVEQVKALHRRAYELSAKYAKADPGGQNHSALMSVKCYLGIAVEALQKAEAHSGHLTPDRKPE